jgi:5-methylcytosine-specific restriction endonuclease McrA
METKICNVCGEEKELIYFRDNRKTCKKCNSKAVILKRQKPTKFCKGCTSYKDRSLFLDKNFLCIECAPPIDSGVKRCCTCKTLQPIGKFCKNNGSKDGYNNVCTECVSQARQNRKEGFDSANIDFTQTKICTQCKEEKSFSDFYIKVGSSGGVNSVCKDCIIQNSAEYRLKNPSIIIEYRAKNKEVLNKKAKEYRENNRERATRSHREYRRRNIEHFREYYKHKYRKNPTYTKVLSALGRSRRKNAEGCFTTKDISILLQKQQGMCVYCNCDIAEVYHIDHIMPLSKGGTNWPDNLQLLCPTCNLRKNAKLPEVYEAEIGFDRQAYEEKIAA